MSTTATYPYSALGDGNKSALLRADTSNWNVDSHTKVLSAPATTVRGLAAGLSALVANLPNALWDVALAFDGKPAGARRRLLGVFDGTIASEAHDESSPWRRADALISTVLFDLNTNDAPDAVRAAVRREIAEQALAGIDDGILVGGVLWADTRKAGFLRMVLNPVMGDSMLTSGDGASRTVNVFFDDLDIDYMRADVEAGKVDRTGHPAIEIGCVRFENMNEFEIVEDLHDLAPCTDRPYGEDDSETIFDETDSDASPYLTVAFGHLEAYMAATGRA